MKFTIQNHAFAAALKHLLPVCPKNPFMPVLEYIKLCFDEQADVLHITGTDTEIVLTVPVPCAYDIDPGSGACLLPAHKLATILGALHGELPVTFEVEQNKATISQGRGSYSFAVEDPKLFPENSVFIETTVNCSIPLSVLKAGLQATLYAVAKEMLRPAMTGVYCSVGGSNITFAATDAHKLALFEAQLETPVQAAIDFIIPAKTASALLKLESEAPALIKLYVGGGKLYVQFAGTSISSNLCEGRFPDAKAVIPQDSPISVIVSQTDLVKAVKRACIFAGKSTFEIGLKTEGADTLHISAQDDVFGNRSSETIACDTIGGEIAIAFNGKMLLECLAANDSNPELCLKMNLPHTAAVITAAYPKPNEKTLTLLMPIMRST